LPRRRVVDFLSRRDTLVENALRSLQRRLGIFFVGASAVDSGACLARGVCKMCVVHFGEQLAGFDGVPFLDVDAQQAAAHLWRDLRVGVHRRLDTSAHLDSIGYGFCFDGSAPHALRMRSFLGLALVMTRGQQERRSTDKLNAHAAPP
jgi:hypothetical protein